MLRGGPIIDRLWRYAYRVAHRLLRLWWLVKPTRSRGAGVAVRTADHLLVVRTSYQDRLDFPCGGLERGEDPQEGARRELWEETGLHVPADRLVGPLHFSFEQHRRWIDLTLYEWWIEHPPTPRVDHREIVEARFVALADLDVSMISTGLCLYLDQCQPTRSRCAADMSDVEVNS